MIYRDKEQLIHTLIHPTDAVLDVGFWGQGVSFADENWVHNLLKSRALSVYAIDLEFDESKVSPRERYFKASAEDFSIPKQFDVVFAGDLIEHLSNPGLFLASAKKHLKADGRIILTTPNAFNLFNMTEKLTKREPTVNPDHTFYFNSKTLAKLLEKNDFSVVETSYLYSLGVRHKESWKKKVLNIVYWILSVITRKYVETLVIVAEKKR